MSRITCPQLSTGRAILLAICCMLFVYGCATKPPAPIPEQGAVPCPEKGPDGDVSPPGLCNVIPVSNPQSASGWLVLSTTTNQPTGDKAPANATCMSGTSKCRFFNTLCQAGTTKKCKHAIYQGTWTVPQPCTCICTTLN